MPRTATLTESGNGAINNWSTRTVNAQNYTGSHSNSVRTQDQELNTVKVGVIFRVKSVGDWKGTSNEVGIAKLIIGEDTYSLTTSPLTANYVQKTLYSGNFKATKRYTQANLDAMYFEEVGGTIYTSQYAYTTNRVHSVEYCYEHNVAGVAAMKLGKIGGLDIGKVWKMGGRSQISGTSDI